MCYQVHLNHLDIEQKVVMLTLMLLKKIVLNKFMKQLNEMNSEMFQTKVVLKFQIQKDQVLLVKVLQKVECIKKWINLQVQAYKIHQKLLEEKIINTV